MSDSWAQIGAAINGEASYDQSGKSVSLSADGSILAIGARWNDGNGNTSGHVRVYKNVNDTWTQVGSDIDGEASNDKSGESIALSADGSILAIGASQNDGNGTRSGHVRVYKNVNDTWTKIGEDIDGESSTDQLGESVSLSADGSILAIGASQNDGNGTDSGHVRVYKNVNDNWTQIGSDIDGEAANDQSGCSINLSNDGSIIAIGAKANSGNKLNSGHVRVYKNVNDTWTQIDEDIDGPGLNDWSGTALSLSNDGSILAIGAPSNDDNGSDSGQVRVYRLSSDTNQPPEIIDGEPDSVTNDAVEAIADAAAEAAAEVTSNEFIATISGTSTSDSLQSTFSNDSIDGLSGTDTVTYTGNFSNYSFIRTDNSIVIADQRTTGTTDGTDTLKNIEYLQFTDQTVEESKVDVIKTYSGNFSDYKFYSKGNGKYEIKTDSGYDDITGYPRLTFTGEATTSSFRDVSAIVDIKATFDQVTGLNTDSGRMFRLYNASFKRLPDPDGLKYWIGKYSSGENDSRAVASSFLVSDEFKQRYGENVSDSTFVNTLYKNVLGRDADASGLSRKNRVTTFGLSQFIRRMKLSTTGIFNTIKPGNK